MGSVPDSMKCTRRATQSPSLSLLSRARRALESSSRSSRTRTSTVTGPPHNAIEHATQGPAVHQAADFCNRCRCLLLIEQVHAMVSNTDEAAAAVAQVDMMSAAGRLSTVEECMILRTHGAQALSSCMVHLFSNSSTSAGTIACQAREVLRLAAPDAVSSALHMLPPILPAARPAENDKIMHNGALCSA